MAPQDYVSRSANKKKSPYKKAPSAPAGLPLKTKLIILFTLAAIAGFSYLLWSIKDQEPAPVATPPVKQTTKASNKNKLPAPPKEKWSYPTDYENKEIEGSKYEVKKGGPYQMQCGSFRTQQQADALKAQIAFTGLESQIRRTTGKNGVYYRVILGPYERKRLAEQHKHKLQANSVLDCQIWLWR